MQVNIILTQPCHDNWKVFSVKIHKLKALWMTSYLDGKLTFCFWLRGAILTQKEHARDSSLLCPYKIRRCLYYCSVRCMQIIWRSDSWRKAEGEVVRERLQGRTSCPKHCGVLLHVLRLSNADRHVWRPARSGYWQLHSACHCQLRFDVQNCLYWMNEYTWW